MKIVIVGGVAGGMSAATRLRRLNENAEIIVFEKGPYVSFANCGLPYHISGEIEKREQLLVQTTTGLNNRFNIDVRPNHEVIQIDRDNKRIMFDHNQKAGVETYDYLILSTGASPITPQIKGIEDSEHIFTLRSIPDLDRIMDQVQQNPKHAVVVGAGFIGLEVAENLAKKGLSVSLVEKAPQVLPPLDEEMASFIQNEVTSKNIDVYTSNSVVEFKDEGQTIVLENGEELSSDLTILSIGVQPESSLAKQAGIKTGLGDGILVNENYQTSDANIYAVGDAIIVKQQITNQETLIPLASPANRQGRQVADIISGQTRKNKGSIGTSIVRVFGLTAASTGLNERNAKQAQLPISVLHISGKNHAGYFPNATDIHLKLIFHSETGEIYGAQAIGQEGVDKRIDVIATAIKGGLSVFDLPELELTYAPPFGSAKDPVNMAGYAAINLIEGTSESVQWYELEDELNKGKILLDVRNDQELRNGQFSHSIHIPLDNLRDEIHQLDKKKEYIVSCHSGLRSYIAERILKQNGFSVKNLDGAFALYRNIYPDKLIYNKK
ncbi:FAD-dependent oxidoreductase [Enterococcus hirae]|uniref:FAD-dependent oxidoreductase n=1 Tax=Enterococcus TaxID=1350 RepID=UPI00102098B0|nr:FAD-dependent oxidoreductase [Enterococcus faecium]RYJ83686.1 CoA-disulfide reductase [Enterococcus faecium]HAR1325070.1 FAD-dependent oxidoreductase [Enterococcus faecium]